LALYRVTNLETDLVRNRWGVLEPDPRKCLRCEQIAMILTPALGFDSSRHRIGYGKGFYDRLFQRLPAIPRLGIGFREQLVEQLPTEPHDISLTDLYLL
jgi:5-formyltetrahydrofolate cyclo-ligase